MLHRYQHLLIAPFALLLLLWPSAAASQATPDATPIAIGECNVTLPNDEIPPGKDQNDDRWYGSGNPDASLWLLMTWADGLYGSSAHSFDQGVDGHFLKFALFRGDGSGDITLTARNANGETVSDEARYFSPDEPYPIPGLISLGAIVPAEGCWTLTATDGNDALTWTVRVASIFDGCDVSVPNGLGPDGTPYDTGDWYGSGDPDASMWLTFLGEAIVRPSPVFEPRDEGGYGIKTPFWRGEGSGPIALTGKRLDQPSMHQPHIDAAWDSYEIPGMIATGIWYPTEGCWELTATDGDDTLTWTVLVESPFANCPVTSGADDDGTIPENVILGSGMTIANPDDYFGENGLYVTRGEIPSELRGYPFGGNLVLESGEVFNKFVWYRQGDAEGTLTIEVRNPDLWFPTEPEIRVPSGYGSSGVQASDIIFPGPGCWEITGTSGDVSITVTVRLEVVPAEQ